MASSKKRSWTAAQRKNYLATIAKRKAQQTKQEAPDHLPDAINAEFTDVEFNAKFSDEALRFLIEENEKLQKQIHDLKVQFHEAVHEMTGTILRLLKGEKL